ncbi:peptidase M16 [Malaciobacter halophilus]|uniref:Peptidase M16 n=2 Tax=Malaciobacter halophilus TaxID=197482 RepID=A0A2N1J2F2_9BACT|nr:zinc-dependent peptidase, M16 family [Malaciobacter halophilus]PKI80739.1 peptidase M16 [Malaciobacter halophilus]
MSAQIKHIDINNTKIPVIFEKQTSLPILNMQLVFQNSGSVQDKDLNGIASFSAKLLNEGTKTLGSTKFASKLESNAISLNVANGFETFVIELSTLKEVNNKAFKLLKKLLEDPNYDKDVVEKIKTIQIGSLKRKQNDYDYVARNQLKEILFKGTALQHPTSGTIESISKIKLKNIKEFINNTFNLSNLIIVAGGDIEFKELEQRLKILLDSIPTKGKKELKRVEILAKPTTKELVKPTEQAYIYFGSKFNAQTQDEDNYKAKVASFILGGSGFGSRLMEEIRVKRGLAYSAYGYVSINKSHSYFTGYLQTKLESAKEAQELVSKIVKDFVKKGVTQEELDAAKNFLTGSEPLRTETLSQRLNRAFNLYYKGLKQDYPQKELEKIQNLKLEELNDYIKSHEEIVDLSFSIVRK